MHPRYPAPKHDVPGPISNQLAGTCMNVCNVPANLQSVPLLQLDQGSCTAVMKLKILRQCPAVNAVVASIENKVCKQHEQVAHTQFDLDLRSIDVS